MEFVTSDLVRLYYEGRDIRPALGGAKATPTSSATTTPKKTFELKNELDESLLTAEDATEIVVEVLDSAIEKVREDDKKELSEFVDEVVERAVDNSEILHPGKVKFDEIARDESKREESVSNGNVLSIAEEIVTAAMSKSEDSSSRIAGNVIEDIVNTAMTQGLPEKTEDTEEAKSPTSKSGCNSPCKSGNREECKSPELYFTPAKMTSSPLRSDTDDSTITAGSTNSTPIKRSQPEQSLSPEEYFSPQETSSVESPLVENNEDTEEAETFKTEIIDDSSCQESNLEKNKSPELSAKIVENKVDVVLSVGAGDSPVKACDESKTEDIKVKNEEVKDAPKTQEDSGSRPSSGGSGRFSVEDRIVPAAISRTASPQPDAE